MIINKSFVVEVLRTALAVTFVIICIFLVLRVMGFLSQAADGLIPVSGVMSLVGLKMVSYLDVILPLMFYIAMIMVLNRWYSDHEMAVLASAGLGISHFLKPAAVLIFVFGGMVALLSFYLTPYSVAKGMALENEYRQSNEVSGIVTGRFVEAKDGNGVYFVESYNRETDNYENVFVYRASFDREGVVVADRAYRTEDEKTKDQFLVLVNGARYEGNPGSPEYRVIEYEQYALRIESNTKRVSQALPIRARSNSELIASSDLSFRSEWYWRVAKVFTLPILTLFALALSHVDSRQGKASGMALALTVYLSYTQLLAYMVALVKKGVVIGSGPIWLVHAIYFVLAVYALYRRNYNLPILPRINVFGRQHLTFS